MQIRSASWAVFGLLVSMAASRPFDWFHVDDTGCHIWYGSDSSAGVDLEDTHFSGVVAAESRFKPRMSLLLKYLGSEGAAVDLGPVLETSNEVVMEWEWEFRPAEVLEIGLIENVITLDNSPDFGVHAGFTRRFFRASHCERHRSEGGATTL